MVRRGGVTSWKRELARCTPLNKIVEMEVEELLAWMVAAQGRTSGATPFKGGGK
jgi:hypothetical protein